MSPVILAAAGVGAYFLLKDKLFKSGGRTIVTDAPSVEAHDPASGHTFITRLDETFADGTKKVDVFLKSSGVRIVKFMQNGSDKSSRVSLGSPPGTDPALLNAAMRLFGIAPKA